MLYQEQQRHYLGNSANMRGESARPGKRPLRALSATEKMEAIQRVHEGESKASVARDIGVPESTLRGWCKSEQKIRGMARNSSTPDSEAHSPASSSGGAKLASSEDESSPAVVAAAAKRGAKIQDPDSQAQQQAVAAATLMADAAANGLAPQHHQAATVDYINSLLQGLASNGLRPEAANALVLQQMSLIANATKNSVLAGLQPPPGLVPPPLNFSATENGLARQKSPSNVPENLSTNAKSTSESLNNNNSNHNNNNSIITSISGKANRTATNSVANQNGKTSSNPLAAAAAKIRAVASASQNQSYDEDFWVWMAQQQQYGAPGYQYFDPKTPQEVSVFWNWYQETNRRYFGGAAQNGGQQLAQPPQQLSPPPPPRQRSPSQVRANMDSVLSNGEAAAKNFHLTESTAQIDSLSTEEAIRYGELFFRWLDRCSDYPTITRLQIMQFKNMLENLKNHKNNKRPANSGLIPNHHSTKHSRK